MVNVREEPGANPGSELPDIWALLIKTFPKAYVKILMYMGEIQCMLKIPVLPGNIFSEVPRELSTAVQKRYAKDILIVRKTVTERHSFLFL
jgi:hypothetical protein